MRSRRHDPLTAGGPGCSRKEEKAGLQPADLRIRSFHLSMVPNSPLVFVHYGASSYLRRTLACARLSNPGKSIFLLGDGSNKHCAAGNADFVDLRDLEACEAAREFDELFQPIQGGRHRFNKAGGTEHWLKFVFKRWFLVEELLRRKSIESFWTFDSDTLVLAPLAAREARFLGCEATTQCRDGCLNGFVGSRRVVQRYTKCMLELFRDKDYLDAQRERLKRQAGLAFNEMDAFCEFRRRERVTTLHAARPLEGEFFDDCLAYDPSHEASPRKIRKNIIVKRICRDSRGAIYTRHLASGEFVRMITCNLSWLPDYVGRKLARFCLTPERDARVMPPDSRELKEVDLSQPLTDKISEGLKGKFYRLKSALGR